MEAQVGGSSSKCYSRWRESHPLSDMCSFPFLVSQFAVLRGANFDGYDRRKQEGDEWSADDERIPWLTRELWW